MTVRCNDFSEFARALYLATDKQLRGKVTLRCGGKNVHLLAEFNGKLVAFATMRSPRIRKADVLLRGYLPQETTLSAVEQRALVEEGRNGFFYKGEGTPEQVAALLVLHWRDLKGRLSAYEKQHKVKRGEIPPRKWAAGIPFSYFTSELVS